MLADKKKWRAWPEGEPFSSNPPLPNTPPPKKKKKKWKEIIELQSAAK